MLNEAAQRLPIFVTEWGTQTYTGDGLNDFDSARAYIQLMNLHKISWINWNYSDDFRSGAVWQPGTCLQNSDWGEMQLKQAGYWIKNQIKITKRNRL
nr:cellulase family glycosylhydrolase [Algicola sagamiensis]